MENPPKPNAAQLDETTLDQVSGGCTFPAQAINLQRQVNITTGRPAIEDVKTDPCGNVISYTERMTRNISAGPWEPK